MKTKNDKKNQHLNAVHDNQRRNKMDAKDANGDIAEKHKNADKNINEYHKK